ncbi:MAG: transcriptional repressor NrdR [Verrucomicrobiae bacterium]|nr:transcriptional repressor NrdR [Verrucomicrobiae bacterium]
MRCLKCNSLEDKVIDSRMSKDGLSIRRRRECLGCGFRFTTYEQLETSDLRVIKRDGGREPFRREKLLEGMVKACEKRPVPIDLLESAVDAIMAELSAEGHREVPTKAIGPKVMAKLQAIDSVAFVRYASVYRQFQDVGEFIEEIESLERLPADPRLQPELFGAGAS